MSAIGISGHGQVHCTCLLLTQSGHPTSHSQCYFEPVRCIVPTGGRQMRRREFISFAGGVALAWSLGARAQEPGRVYRIAIVVPVGRDEAPNLALIDELRKLGFVEGENLLIVPGGFLTTNEQVAEVVPAMIKAAPDVIVVGGDPISRAFQKATQSIPLLVMTEDMVGAGFAASLARPGGNITGISLMSPELDGKRQDILIEAVPAAHRIAALADSNVSTLQHLKGLEDLRGRTDGSWWWFVLPAPTTSLLR